MKISIDEQKFKSIFSKNLRKYRKEKKFTQYEIANMLYISRTTYTKWETGSCFPNPIYLFKLSKILEISTTEFFNGIECEWG